MKNKLKVLVALCLAFTLMLSVVGCGGGSSEPAKSEPAASEPAKSEPAKKADPVKISISHTSSLESPWQKASLKFADMVNSESDGKYKVEVFGNGVLCQKNWKVMLEMTQSGSSQIGIESLTALASLVPEIGAVSIPFLFTNEKQLLNFLDTNPPVLQKWLKKFEEKNIVILAVAPRPFRQNVNSVRNIKTPEDIKGLKFRVPENPTFVKIFELLGAKPVPMSSGEIYSAIQLGTVVGEDNSIPVVYDFKSHEVAKYFTIWNYIADTSMIFINKDIWDGMSDEDKALYQKAAKEWVNVNVKEDADYTVVAMDNMKKAGVEFYEMPAEDKAPFKEMMQPLYEDFQKMVGDEDWKAFNDAVEAAK